MTPRREDEEEIFFQAGMSLPIGGQTKATSLAQSTEKASVAREPGYAYREKKREERAFEGDAKRSIVKPLGRKRD